MRNQQWIKALELARESGARECHSLHCRHYDLADGKQCVIETARLIYQSEELVARGQVTPIAEEI